MRILGIDPGLQVCGYACLQAERGAEKLIEAGVIRTERDDALEQRLNRIAEDAESLIRSFAPEVVAVEELYSHYAHPRTAILMGHARGVILQKCAAAAIEVRSFSATRIKKSVTGLINITIKHSQILLLLPLCQHLFGACSQPY